jgi:hypothetical protein
MKKEGSSRSSSSPFASKGIVGARSGGSAFKPMSKPKVTSGGGGGSTTTYYPSYSPTPQPMISSSSSSSSSSLHDCPKGYHHDPLAFLNINKDECIKNLF